MKAATGELNLTVITLLYSTILIFINKRKYKKKKKIVLYNYKIQL